MKTDDGFILIEALVSLAMVSVLAVGTLDLLQSVASAYRNDPGEELAKFSLQASLNPEQIGDRTDVRLESIHTLNDDSTWRVYSYRSEDGERVTIPVFVPAKE